MKTIESNTGKLPAGSYVIGYAASTAAGIQCRLDKTLHHHGVLLPVKAGEAPFGVSRDRNVAHPERRALRTIRRAIERSEHAAKECKQSLHRDFAPFTILIHAGPYLLYRIWKAPDGTLFHKRMPEMRRKRGSTGVETKKKSGLSAALFLHRRPPNRCQNPDFTGHRPPNRNSPPPRFQYPVHCVANPLYYVTIPF